MDRASPSSLASHARSGSCPPPTAARSSGPCLMPPGQAHQPAQGVLSLPPGCRLCSPTPAAWPDCLSAPAPARGQPDTPSPQRDVQTIRPPGEGPGSPQPKATSRLATRTVRAGSEPDHPAAERGRRRCCRVDGLSAGAWVHGRPAVPRWCGRLRGHRLHRPHSCPGRRQCPGCWSTRPGRSAVPRRQVPHGGI
jgi:hypothetical protein